MTRLEHACKWFAAHDEGPIPLRHFHAMRKAGYIDRDEETDTWELNEAGRAAVTDVGAPPNPRLALRRAIIDAMLEQPPPGIGAILRRGLIEAREPGAHPEDRCERCEAQFVPWAVASDEWERVTGRSWGGPILCRPCFGELLRERSKPSSAPTESEADDA